MRRLSSVLNLRGALPRLVVATAALAWSAFPVAAQAKLQITPYFTSHFPTREFDHFDNQDPTSPVVTDAKQTVGPGVGGKLTYWLTPQFAIEGDLNYASSGLRLVTVAAVGVPDPISNTGNVFTATGRVVFRPRRSNLLLGAGAGYMTRGGKAWNDDLLTGAHWNTGNFTAVASVGAYAHVTARMTILASLDALLYSVEKISFDQPNPNHDLKPFQVDLQFKLGIPIGLVH